MSNYDWEKGDIVIPSKAWAAFRTELITEWNKLQNNLYDEACKTFSTIKEKFKGKKDVSWRDAINEYVENHDHYHMALAIANLILTKEYKLVQPKKKDLKIYPVSKDVSFRISERAEVFIGLSNESHTLHYAVPENNHACRDARDLPIVRKMFNLLDKITWVKNSGGVIMGNDEYNDENGGGSYTTQSYGINRR